MRACVGILASISVLSGSILFAAHFMVTPTLTDLVVFHDSVNYPGILGIVEACMAGATVLIGLVSAQALLCDDDKRNARCPLRVSGAIYVVFALASAVILFVRGMNTGIFGMDGVCTDTSLQGCPPVRYESVLPFDIETTDHCKLNVWTENPDLFQSPQLSGSMNMTIDWSLEESYDTRDFNPNSNKLFDNGFVPPDLTNCVHWGCHKVCNEQRHRVNEVWFYASVLGTVVYMVLAILGFTAPVPKDYRKVRTTV